MGLFDTTAEEVTENFLREALKEALSLQEWMRIVVEELERHLDEHPGNAFPINWLSTMMKKVLVFQNGVARANGACLVRAKSPKAEAPITTT